MNCRSAICTNASSPSTRCWAQPTITHAPSEPRAPQKPTSQGVIRHHQAQPSRNCFMPTFDAQSTTDDILGDADLRGTPVLITGTSAGLGVETARSLSVRGAQVTGVVRDVEKARANLDEAGAQGVELVGADLASLASGGGCADAVQDTGDAIGSAT